METTVDILPKQGESLCVIGGVFFYILDGSIFAVEIDKFVSNPDVLHPKFLTLDKEFSNSGIKFVVVLEDSQQIQISNNAGSLATINYENGDSFYLKQGTGLVKLSDGETTHYKL